MNGACCNRRFRCFSQQQPSPVPSRLDGADDGDDNGTHHQRYYYRRMQIALGMFMVLGTAFPLAFRSNRYRYDQLQQQQQKHSDDKILNTNEEKIVIENNNKGELLKQNDDMYAKVYLSPIVLEEYKLVFFHVPKVACSGMYMAASFNLLPYPL